MTSQLTQILYCPDHVFWIVEQTDLLLINKKKYSHQRLPYPDVAVWDLLSRNTPEDRLLKILETVTALSPEGVKSLVERCLNDWIADGWLENREMT
jgi:hypothetical protein